MAEHTYAYILASKGLSLTSQIIKWFQFGFPYTHIAYVVNYGSDDFIEHDPVVIEAWWPEVRIGRFSEVHTPGTPFTVFRVPVTLKEKVKIEDFLMRQIGRKYDVIGLLAFLTRLKRVAKNNYWFCSELTFAAFKNAGVELLKFTEPQEVTPALFLKSPLLEKVYDSHLPGEPINEKISLSLSGRF